MKDIFLLKKSLIYIIYLKCYNCFVVVIMLFKEGDIAVGKVTGIKEYGIFVSFDSENSGLVHISEVSNCFINNLNDYAKVGDYITVKVISSEKNGHYKLSIKEFAKYRKQNKREIIHETRNGFNTLKSKLNDWIDNFDQF